VLQSAPAAPPALGPLRDKLLVDDVRVGIHEVGQGDGRGSVERRPLETERREDALPDVLLVGKPATVLDDLPEQREREVRVVPAATRRKHLLGVGERLHQARAGGEVERLPDRAGRLALQAGEMREHAPDGRAGPLDAVEVNGERIVERERSRVA